LMNKKRTPFPGRSSIYFWVGPWILPIFSSGPIHFSNGTVWQDQSILAHWAFIISEMARTKLCAATMNLKADNMGEKCTEKHIYANPLGPKFCSFLYLGIFFSLESLHFSKKAETFFPL
jgi:hypothetical protein